MSKISELILRPLHKKLAASKNTPATITASSGTVNTAVSAALTEADDYWNGAIAVWTSGPNAGLYSSVKDFDAATDKLTFDEDLPNAVANTHQFVLLHGGKYSSDQRIPGMTAAAPVNVTGFSVNYAAMINGEGIGVLRYYYNGGVSQGLTWQPPGGTEGAQVNISAAALNDLITLYGGGATDVEKSKFLQVKRTAAALAGSDKTDNIALVLPVGTFLAPFTGDEALAGVTIYRPVAIENIAATKIFSLRAFCTTPFPSAANTTIAAGGNIGTVAGTLKGTSFTNWGTHGFVYNSTKNDLRYYYERSGNSVQVLAPGGGIRGFAAVNWDVGDTLEPFPWFDIGLDAPAGGNLFEDPASETTAPAGVAFSCPRTQPTGLLIGDLAVSGIYVIWERWFIPATFQPVEGGDATLRIYAETTE